MTVNVKKRWYLMVALLLLGGLLGIGAPFGDTPAAAAPAPLRDPDGNTGSLQVKLRELAKGYADAAAKLTASQKRQATLTAEMNAADARVNQLVDEINLSAGLAYRTGRVGTVSALLDSGSPDEFFARAMTLDTKLRLDDNMLRDLRFARYELAVRKQEIDAEVKVAQARAADLAKKKKETENTLASMGIGVSSGLNGARASATPARRNADGSWPPESCSMDDPTTSGCLTPRTLHAYQQARAAGFTRYTSCFRPSGSGEHPRGRACDFAAQTSGFGGTAYGADKTYGDRLSSWLIGNADRLGVLYVIWYRQIWMPGVGWRSYSGDGSPAGDHTNHVHMSIY